MTLPRSQQCGVELDSASPSPSKLHGISQNYTDFLSDSSLIVGCNPTASTSHFPVSTMVAISTTPPPIQAPTAKEKKYDRQLRLWAATGQRALEDSHVLLVVPDQAEGSGSSVAGVEALKNLILPSIGSFTIADSATVKIADLGVNFFLEEGSLGKSRAEECTRLLEELNPDVTGYAITRVSDDSVNMGQARFLALLNPKA